MPDGVRVVLIEDHRILRELLSEQAKEAGCEVVAATDSGAAGIEAIAKHRPDCALIDLSLPDIDGYTVIWSARRASPSTRMIVLSASIDPVSIKTAFDVGADGYVDKGAGIDELLSLLREASAGERVVSANVAMAVSLDELGIRAPEDAPRDE